jgi:16S rRNA (guanine(1405)-N(7))-methyltransferase
MNLITEIKKSKKYAAVYETLLERVCSEESVKYKKDKEKIKAVKNRLHEIYGAFLSENSVKLAGNIINDGDFSPSFTENLLKLNTSSNERLSFISELYKFIFDMIDVEINMILDVGCGFNPFSLPYMLESTPKLNIKSYYALDIDVNLAEIINKYFDLLGLPKYAGCIDLISETPSQKTNVAFLFKVIPTIETCKKGRGVEILNSLDAKYIVVSFPTKTLCGKDKGMADNYAAFFEGSLDYEKFKIVGKNIFQNELVYVLYHNDEKN